MSYQHDEMQAISESVARKFMKGIRALFGFFKQRDRILAGQLGPLPIASDVVNSLVKLRAMRNVPYISSGLRAMIDDSLENIVEPIAQMYVDVPILVDDVMGLTKRPGQTEVIDSGLMFQTSDLEEEEGEELDTSES